MKQPNYVARSQLERISISSIIGGPFIALLYVAIVLHKLSLLNFFLLVGGWLYTGFGVTVMYHRYFTHRSFDFATIVFRIPWLKLVQGQLKFFMRPVVLGPEFWEIIFGIPGLMAYMGRILEWIANHIAHHAHSDKVGDPHSPLEGLLHAHMGWMLGFRIENKEDFLSPAARESRSIAFLDRHLALWLILSLTVPSAIALAITGSWYDAWTAFNWTLVRIFMVHHITWSVNSVGHRYGSQDFHTSDQSRNNRWCALLSLGEGWHNCHHKFMWSAKHGLLPRQFDPSWEVIKLMERIGIAKNVRVPTEDEINSKLAA